MDRQGFGIRLLAALLDFVAIIILAVLVSLMFGRGCSFNYQWGSGADRAFNLVLSLVVLAYFSTEVFSAASPGKMILGLRIASETGSPAPQNQLITRWVIKHSGTLLGLLVIIPFIGFLFGILSFIAGLAILVGCFFALGPKRQALHDVLAHTAVYKMGPAAMVGPGVVATPPPPVV